MHIIGILLLGFALMSHSAGHADNSSSDPSTSSSSPHIIGKVKHYSNTINDDPESVQRTIEMQGVLIREVYEIIYKKNV